MKLYDGGRAPNPRRVRIFLAETESTGGALDQLAEIPGVRAEVVPGTTHFLPMERPYLVRQALRDTVAG